MSMDDLLERLGNHLVWRIGKAEAEETPIGFTPTPESLDLTGLDVSDADLEDALKVDREEWAEENELIEQWLGRFGESLPQAIRDRFEAQKRRFAQA